MEDGLIRTDGTPFTASDLSAIVHRVNGLDATAREELRDQNAEAIAAHPAERILIGAGPGTGKSYLFMARIAVWLRLFDGQPIYVSSFVRKLILDLQQRVRSSDLPDEAQALVTVSTLHTLARSVVERNGGTASLPMAPYIRMIGEDWKRVVWQDVLHLAPGGAIGTIEQFEARYHEMQFTDDEPWPWLHATYERLCQFYNALGFADSILLAAEALVENPELSEHALWIFDEFQDFNTAEEHLVRVCMDGADSVLLAGDDDQAIYQSFKGSRPGIIRSWYRDQSVANAMLPLCGRSSFHICTGASAFLAGHDTEERIDKVFLPIDTNEGSSRIQVVVASNPGTAVAYVQEFIDQHEKQISARADDITSGQSDESYLLVLSPNGDPVDYLGDAGTELLLTVEQWRLEEAGPGEDWQGVLLYYLHEANPLQNFTLRKVLHLEGVSNEDAARLVSRALEANLTLSTIEDELIARTREKCRLVQATIRDEEASAREKATRLDGLLGVSDQERLAQDLDAFPIGQAPTEEDAAVETTRFVSPVEFMTMYRAKGLSADHVIVLGADATNMGYATPELFYVALTRARVSLHLVVPLEAKGARQPHEFVLELPEENCTYAKYLKSGREPFRTRGEFASYFDQREYRIRQAATRRG